MTPQELKNSILQLAIQGKLVEQRPEEGTAEELYQQIQAEKQVLIKAGKIKKEKPLPEIAEDEKPFDIPESWMWVHIGDYCLDIFSGKSPKYEKTETDFRVIGQAANQQNGLDYSQLKYTNADFWNSNEEKYFLRKYDVLLNTLGNGTLGRSGIIIDLLYPMLTDGHLFVFRSVNSITSTYVYYYLQFKRAEIEKAANGSTNQTFLSLGNTKRWIIPIPPLAEQKRIVAKIEELLPLIDRYEEAWTKLEAINKRFPDDMQKSLLQMAIQGKLVEQRPEEGTGEELYAQIQAEKQALIKSGKIKKDKPLPEITDDEKPFDIPDSWKWVRWGALSESIQYGFNAPAKEKGRIRMVRISDIQDGNVLWDTVPFCDIAENDIETYLLGENDILFARTGGTVGKSFLVKEVPYESVYAGYLIRTRYSSLLCPEYMKHFMESQLYWEQLRNGTIATAQPNCNGQTLSKMILPLPPLAEQKRIVAKLEELLPLCERLK